MYKGYFITVLLSVVFALNVLAQQPKLIEISNLSIAMNGREVAFMPELTFTLEGDNTHDIKLFHHDGLSVGVLFEWRKQGQRLRLDQRTYVETSDGRRRFSSRNRLFNEADASYAGRLSGRSLEHITYDPVLIKRIFASFNFTLHY
jgi:hypothetical protein